MANLSAKFSRSPSQRVVDTKLTPVPSLPPSKSAGGLLKGVKNLDASNELLEASERFQGEIVEPSTESACFHCKESPASGDSSCHVCGHTACVRCSKLFRISERFHRKKEDGPLRVCFQCKDMLLLGEKSKESKKEIAPPVWEVTDAYSHCFMCHTNRHQHNCRACGELFCSNCTTKRKDVPEYFDRKAKTGGLRVCDRCRFDIIGGATFSDNHQKVREGIESASVGNVACLPLSLVLTVPQYSSALRDFLAQNHALENLNFLSSVDIFRAVGKQDPSLLLPVARQIHQEFLIPTANQLVNVQAVIRDSIEKAVVDNQVKIGVFDAAVTAVIAMVEKDVYRRFATSQESKNLLRESDATTFTNYLSGRNRRMSFSILQKKEDIPLLDAIMAALNFQKMLKTVRKGLAWYNDSIEGSHLVAYLHKEKYATSRPGAISIGQRLIEAGYICHVLDPTLDFADSDLASNVYQEVDSLALAKKFPSIASLFKVRENVFGNLLYRGVAYCRLWGAVSVEHMKLFFWRKEDGMHGHSALNLKGASVVFETGGEEDEDEGGFSGGVKDSLGGKDALLRHGQVYMRITVARDKAVLTHVPEASPSPELVYLLEEPSLRSRWKKCFEKECKIPVKMIYTAGVSKRAAFVASSPQTAKKHEAKDEVTKTSSDSFTKVVAPATSDISPKNMGSVSPSASGMMSPNDRHMLAAPKKTFSPPPAADDGDAPPPPPRSPIRLRGNPPPPLLDAPPPPPPSPVPPPPAYTPPPSLPVPHSPPKPDPIPAVAPTSGPPPSLPVPHSPPKPDPLPAVAPASGEGVSAKPARIPRSKAQ
jgi:hypothetical protein